MGKIWHVYPNGEMNNILFEGSETAARKYIRQKYSRDYKKGYIRLAKVIWEGLTSATR